MMGGILKKAMNAHLVLRWVRTQEWPKESEKSLMQPRSSKVPGMPMQGTPKTTTRRQFLTQANIRGTRSCWCWLLSCYRHFSKQTKDSSNMLSSQRRLYDGRLSRPSDACERAMLCSHAMRGSPFKDFDCICLCAVRRTHGDSTQCCRKHLLKRSVEQWHSCCR